MNRAQKALIGKALLVGYGVLGILVIILVVTVIRNPSTTTQDAAVEVLDLGVVPILAGPGQRMTANVILADVEEEVVIQLPESIETEKLELTYYAGTAPDNAAHGIVTTQRTLEGEQLSDLVRFLTNQHTEQNGFMLSDLVTVVTDTSQITLQGVELAQEQKQELEEELDIELKTELE